MTRRDSLLFVALGCLLVAISGWAYIFDNAHFDLFEDAFFIGACAIAIGLLERKRDDA